MEVFKSASKRYTNEIKQVREWIEEGTNITDEVYLVASAGETVTGILYATVYTERLHKCVLNAITLSAEAGNFQANTALLLFDALKK